MEGIVCWTKEMGSIDREDECGVSAGLHANKAADGNRQPRKGHLQVLALSSL